MSELKPCPFCGGSVVIAYGGDEWRSFLFVTRGTAPDACRCRVFMESMSWPSDKVNKDIIQIKDDLVAAWNRRAE